MNKSYVLRIGRFNNGRFLYEIADGCFYGAAIHRSSSEGTLAEAASKGAVALLRCLQRGADDLAAAAKLEAQVEEAVAIPELFIQRSEGTHAQPSRMKFFAIGGESQNEFDRWAAKVEEETGGALEIICEEPVLKDGQTTGFMLWYRIGERGYDADAELNYEAGFGPEDDDSEYDGEMPKVDPGAKRIKEFLLGDNFQAEFDAWALQVEKEHGGSLEITHEEIIHDGVKILIFWRIVHGPHAAKGRR